METQIYFLGTSPCPSFTPNVFKKDICQSCCEKINKHSSASEHHLRDALNYFVDKEPSLIWSGNGNLYMGGYKTAINIPSLKERSIGLIMNASGDFEDIMGPKYLKELNKRRSSQIAKEIRVNWIDSQDQILDPNELLSCIKEMEKYIKEGKSVLIHCAQGKSRSSVLALAWFLFQHPEATSLDRALRLLKEKRPMAEPNPGFISQLKHLESKHFFDKKIIEGDQ